MSEIENTPTRPGYERRRKVLALISLGVVLVLVGLLTLFMWRWLRSFSQEDFRAYIRSFGAVGWLILLGLQVLQVFIALIPGELVESAAGYIFGPLIGTLICYIGIAIASVLIFRLTRRYGVKLVEVFITREKLLELRFLNTQRKRNRLLFLLYFIPGTPKDLLTYFAGLTDIPFNEFLTISLTARLPSIVTSTIGGHMLGSSNYWGAVVMYGITGIASITGLWLYNSHAKKHQK
jgi:uncharacterized membrane protein YdjX (TVP38/TMEM64 family)